MRENVARPQLRDHALDDGVGILAVGAAFRQTPELTEMHVERQVGLTADLRRHLQHFDAPAREAADLGMSLDAAHDVLVGIGRQNRRVDIDAVGAVETGIEMPFQPADQISRQEGKNARLGFFDDEIAEAGQGHAGRAALIDDRGDARVHADHVGIHAEPAGHILIDMPVRVDEARQNDLAFGVDHLFRRTRQDVFLHRGNAAAPDRDVHHAVDAGSGADHLTPADDDVERRIFNHARGPSSVRQGV